MGELKYLELHGDRIAYRDAGSGETLLLIHGMAGSSDTWRAVIPQLAQEVPRGGARPARPRAIGQAAR